MDDNRQFNAKEILEEALQKHNINLAILIAETAIWASPEVHKRLCEKGSPAWFPNTKRAKKGKKENRGDKIEDIKLDDNTYANNAIKKAIGVNRTNIKDYAVCHIWDGTCYDERYHTAIANLVLIPRPLAGLTDYYEPIKAMLRYRAFELYGWYPDNELPPIKPENYISCWREPELDPLTIKKERKTRKNFLSGKNLVAHKENRPSIEDRLSSWHIKKSTNVHKIIQLLLDNEGLSRDKFIRLLDKKRISKDSYGAVSSLMTDKGNAYGLVFVEDKSGGVCFHPNVKKHLQKIRWE